MRLRQLWLVDFRNYESAALTLPEGLTVVIGDNGEGKTNLLEAAGYLATLSSFRGAPSEAMVRRGASKAVVRGEGERKGRSLLVEAEIAPVGRGRVSVNRQPLRRSSDLLGAVRVSVFSPDDLELVGGGPAGRRRYLDDTLVSLHPRYDALRRDFERVLRQRNRLLSQSAGRRGEDIISTLDVWDRQLVDTGEGLATARAGLVERLEPALAKAYARLAEPGNHKFDGHGPVGPEPDAAPPGVTATYDAPWRQGGLAAALSAIRAEELRRGVSLVGPHRDDLVLSIGGMPARTHASRGEQRSLALGLRLAAHDVITESVGEAPLLLLDDVFSELDDGRSRALLDHLPPGQALLTTTGAIPAGAVPDCVLSVASGRVSVVRGEC